MLASLLKTLGVLLLVAGSIALVLGGLAATAGHFGQRSDGEALRQGAAYAWDYSILACWAGGAAIVAGLVLHASGNALRERRLRDAVLAAVPAGPVASLSVPVGSGGQARPKRPAKRGKKKAAA